MPGRIAGRPAKSKAFKPQTAIARLPAAGTWRGCLPRARFSLAFSSGGD